MKLTSVTHHIESNTLEAVWLKEVVDVEGSVIGYERAMCQAYSAEQKDEFIADTGAPQYAELAGW